MIRNIFTVGGWTLVSRVTGFVRDVVMAAILGAVNVRDWLHAHEGPRAKAGPGRPTRRPSGERQG